MSSGTCSLAVDAGEGSWQRSVSRRSWTSLILLPAMRHHVPTSLYPNTAVSQRHHIPTSSYPNATVPQHLHISISLHLSSTVSQCHCILMSSYPNTTVSQCHHTSMSLYPSHHIPTPHPNIIISQHHHRISVPPYPNVTIYISVTISQCCCNPVPPSLYPKATVSESRSVRPDQLLLRLPAPYSSHQTVMWEQK